MPGLQMWIPASALVILMLSLIGCKEEVNVVMEYFDSVHDQALADAAYQSTFDLAADVVLTQCFTQGNISTILPSDARIQVSDSSMMDGDGWEFTITLGNVGKKMPFGKLCPDGMYRSGTLRIKVADPQNAIGNVIQVQCGSADSFYTGDGTVMTQIVGNMSIVLRDSTLYEILVHDAIAQLPGREILWSCERLLEIESQPAKGMLGSRYRLTGSSGGNNRLDMHFTSEIEAPLIKTVDIGCSQHYRTGIFNVSESSNERFIRVDYDAFANGECDAYVLVHSANGKRNIVRLN